MKKELQQRNVPITKHSLPEVTKEKKRDEDQTITKQTPHKKPPTHEEKRNATEECHNYKA